MVDHGWLGDRLRESLALFYTEKKHRVLHFESVFSKGAERECPEHVTP
jgi:hypothetical protein